MDRRNQAAPGRNGPDALDVGRPAGHVPERWSRFKCDRRPDKKRVSGPVKTFSVGYAEEQYSELGYASQVARAIGTDHHEVRVSMEDFFNALPRLIWHEDEPITWPSSVSL